MGVGFYWGLSAAMASLPLIHEQDKHTCCADKHHTAPQHQVAVVAGLGDILRLDGVGNG